MRLALIACLLLLAFESGRAQYFGFYPSTMDVGIVPLDSTLKCSASVYGQNRHTVNFSINASSGITDYDTEMTLGPGPAEGTISFKFRPYRTGCLAPSYGLTIQNVNTLLLYGYCYDPKMMIRKEYDTIQLSIDYSNSSLKTFINWPGSNSDQFQISNVKHPFYSTHIQDSITCYGDRYGLKGFKWVDFDFKPTSNGIFVDTAYLISSSSKDTTQILLIGDASKLSIKDPSLSSGFIITPNPCKNQLSIYGDRGFAAKVFNILGHQVISQVTEGTTLTCNLSNVPDGIYYVEMSHDGVSSSQRIVVQH